VRRQDPLRACARRRGSADSGLAVLVYIAEAGSKSAETLDLLASWTATIEAADASKSPERTT
jgi:hypothetical protein